MSRSTSDERTTPDPEDATASAVTRRGFLRSTAGGGLAVFAASLVPARCGRDYAASERDGVELAALSPREYAVARATAEALLVGVPVTPAAVAAGIDRELALVGDPVRTDMKTVFTLLEHLTPLGGRVRPFTRLSPEERRAYLRGWATSRFDLRRAAFQATRGFVYFFAYSDPATRSLTGFQGAWPERFDIPYSPVDFGEVA